MTDTTAQLLVFSCRDLIFGGELTLPIETWSFAAPVNLLKPVWVVVLSLQRLSYFPQIWFVLNSSSHRSLLGLNRTFSSIVWHGSLVHPYHWTLKLRCLLLPPRAAEEMEGRKISWPKCKGVQGHVCETRMNQGGTGGARWWEGTAREETE